MGEIKEKYMKLRGMLDRGILMLGVTHTSKNNDIVSKLNTESGAKRERQLDRGADAIMEILTDDCLFAEYKSWCINSYIHIHNNDIVDVVGCLDKMHQLFLLLESARNRGDVDIYLCKLIYILMDIFNEQFIYSLDKKEKAVDNY